MYCLFSLIFLYYLLLITYDIFADSLYSNNMSSKPLFVSTIIRKTYIHSLDFIILFLYTFIICIFLYTTVSLSPENPINALLKTLYSDIIYTRETSVNPSGAIYPSVKFNFLYEPTQLLSSIS